MAPLWGGRFSTDMNALAAALNNSMPFDYRLGEVDVQGSLAWADAILQAGIITPEEASQIRSGLQSIAAEMAAGTFNILPDDEDIHTAVERRLGELIGAAAGKLHTGRSRNDQVATDFRLWLLKEIARQDGMLKDLQSALVERAEADLGIILPGYTHFQRAQPVLLSHWWLSHFWALQRDRQRLADLAKRTSVCPLGCGALAGTPFNIDRETLATALGFDSAAPNSLDAISDRDFAAEFSFMAALLGVHVWRMAEALILYSTAEFGFVEIADAFSTGSSLMPQKKNADTLELTRGKAGTLIGRLTGLLTMLKGLPSAYDKDMQEDKPAVFEAAETLQLLLPVMAGVLRTLTVRPVKMQAALDTDMLATDLADYLVRQGIPFRQAHKLVGMAVRRAQELNMHLADLPQADRAAIHPVLGEDISSVFSFEDSVARRSAKGGAGPLSVQQQLAEAHQILAR